MKKVLYILTITLAAVSCEKTIEFKGKATAPMLVVNSIISPDSTIKAEVSASRFFLENDIEIKRINNADLKLIVNGTDRVNLTYLSSTGFYEADYKIYPGDEVEIKATASGYASVFGKTKIPAQPTILSVDTTATYSKMYDYYGWEHGNSMEYDTIGEYTSQNIRFSMKFKDNAAEKNYYRIIVKKRIYPDKSESQDDFSVDREYIEYYFSYFDDVVFKNQNQLSGFEKIFDEESGDSDYFYNMFSDELINGKEYELKFSDFNALNHVSYQEDRQNRPNPEKVVYLIHLQEVSSDYYLFVKSMDAANKTGGNPFVEPVQVLSNIENGIGLLGSYTSSKPYVIEINY